MDGYAQIMTQLRGGKKEKKITNVSFIANHQLAPRINGTLWNFIFNYFINIIRLGFSVYV